jgi:hypothetical protein
MVAQTADESSLRLRQSAEDLYHEGEWIGKRAYKGYNVVEVGVITKQSW